jgi:hypothetical protein
MASKGVGDEEEEIGEDDDFVWHRIKAVGPSCKRMSLRRPKPAISLVHKCEWCEGDKE